jgi:putative transposase
MVRRNSLRLENYDYSSRGNYFITICTYQRECFFGLPDSKDPIEKSLQKIVKDCWNDCLSENVTSLEFVIMPNHLHGIIKINQSIIPVLPVGAIHESPLLEANTPVSPFQKPPGSMLEKGSLEWIKARRQMLLSKIIGKFKMQSSKQVNDFLEDHFEQRPFKWQRNYYDHIIRNPKSLKRIIQYIKTNPERWKEDILNPANHEKFQLMVYSKRL